MKPGFGRSRLRAKIGAFQALGSEFESPLRPHLDTPLYYLRMGDMRIVDWLKLGAIVIGVLGYLWYANSNDSSEIPEWETDITYHEGR